MSNQLECLFCFTGAIKGQKWQTDILADIDDESDVILANQLLTHIPFCSCNQLIVMDRFLINKRPALITPTRSQRQLLGAVFFGK